LFYLGEFASARSHAEQGLALYDPQQHRHLAYRGAGLDVGVLCFGGLIHPLWYLGYPDQALRRSHEAVTLAQGLAVSHHATLTKSRPRAIIWPPGGIRAARAHAEEGQRRLLQDGLGG
jgi:hypothetical protein